MLDEALGDADTFAGSGVTKEQARILSKAGCTFAQGYLFGKPMPAAEIVEMLGTKRRTKRSA